jgi:C4-dicarboxylate transporter, DctQ subunit
VHSLLRLTDRAIALVCWAGLALSAIALLSSFGLVAYSVGMRYLLGRPVPWVDEMVGYLLVALVMLAAADAMRRGEHIAVDLITDRLSPARKKLMTVAALVSVVFCGVVLVIAGLETAAFTQFLGIRSTGYLNVPMHIPQLFIPVGGGLLALAAAGGLLRMAMGLRPEVETEHGHTSPDPKK